MEVCNCQSEERYECERRRTGGINSGVECFCPCHSKPQDFSDEDEEDEPTCGQCGSPNCTGSCREEE